jgi:hypothetical protein
VVFMKNFCHIGTPNILEQMIPVYRISLCISRYYQRDPVIEGPILRWVFVIILSNEGKKCCVLITHLSLNGGDWEAVIWDLNVLLILLIAVTCSDNFDKILTAHS